MTSVIPSRRRAEEFAALVDGLGSLGDSRYSDLLELVGTLRETEAATPRAQFVSDLRSALMAEADTALTTVDLRLSLPAHTRTRRDRRIAIAAGAFAIFGASSSMAVASQSALPGDALYPIKRVLESAQTSLQMDDAARAQKILDNASGRLDEISELAARDNAASNDALPETLDDFIAQATQAADILLADYLATGDSSSIEALRKFTASSMVRLDALNGLVPAEVRDELDQAAQVLVQIDEQARLTCPTCGGGPLDVPAWSVMSASTKPPAAHKVSPTPVFQPAVPVDVDPIKELIGQLPIDTEGDGAGTGSSDPAVSPPKPGTDANSDGGSDVTKPLKEVTDAVVDGLEATTSEDGPLATLLDPLLGEGGLLGTTP